MRRTDRKCLKILYLYRNERTEKDWKLRKKDIKSEKRGVTERRLWSKLQELQTESLWRRMETGEDSDRHESEFS